MIGLNHVKETIKRLTDRKGVAVWFYSVLQAEMSTTTGQADRRLKVIPIKRVLALPIDGTRNFDYDLSFIAANKNFVFGAYFDKGAFICVIDYKALKGVVPTLNDFIILGQQQYEVKKIGSYPDQQIYILGVEGVGNKAPYKFCYADTRLSLGVTANGNE